MSHLHPHQGRAPDRPERPRRRLTGTLAAAALLAGAFAGAFAGPAAGAEAADDAPELIVNGDFASGTAPWWWTANSPASVVDGQLCAEVPAGTVSAWDAIVGQNDLPLTAGESYTLSFTATATAPVTIRTNVQMAVDPYTTETSSADQITATAQTIEHTFTAAADNPAAQLAFQIGGSAQAYTFCVDDVSLRGGAEPPVYEPDTGSPVRVNQVGYLTDGPKNGTFVTESTEPLPWRLDNADGTEQATGITTPLGVDPTSRQNVQHFDFSDFATPGDGYTVTIDGQTSEPFSIGDDLYSGLRTDALAYFYHNRSGIEIDANLVGDEYARPAGHLNVAPNQGDNNVPCVSGVCDYTRDVIGGWYDAGDQGKYVVNGGISVAELMSSFERTLTAQGADGAPLGDGKLRVPEGGNSVPDILDEARWELEFLLKMQVPAGKPLAGMAFHKVHDAQWTGLALRPDQDPQPRELHAPSTAATLNLAATAAQCARLFRPYDADFADQCLAAARTAWTAAKANPEIYASPVDATGGGAYDDSNVTDEFYWAAAELFITTGEDTYRDAVLTSPVHGSAEKTFPGQDSVNWGSVAGLGALDLATVPNNLTGDQLTTVRDVVTGAADRFAADSASAAYGVPYAPEGGHYVWGSNSNILNNMVVLGTAYDLTGESGYRDAVLRGVDYILGGNPLNQSYVTGYGERNSHNQHHRFWAHSLNASLPNPTPGSLAGGPNDGLQDPVAVENLQDCPPAMCYIDNIESYSTNEVAINWNAPLAWVASFVDDLGSGASENGGGPDDPKCKASYQVANQWDQGFTGNVTISCSGASLKGWQVEWDYPAGQQLSQAWNSLCTQSGTHVTCTNADYNGTVPDGGSVAFGFNATWRGSNPVPSPITVT